MSYQEHKNCEVCFIRSWATQLLNVQCLKRDLFLDLNTSLVFAYISIRVMVTCCFLIVQLCMQFSELCLWRIMNGNIVLFDVYSCWIWHLQPVLSGAKVKGISAFCLNENPLKSSPFSVEVSWCSFRRVCMWFCFFYDKTGLLFLYLINKQK